MRQFVSAARTYLLAQGRMSSLCGRQVVTRIDAGHDRSSWHSCAVLPKLYELQLNAIARPLRLAQVFNAITTHGLIPLKHLDLLA